MIGKPRCLWRGRETRMLRLCRSCPSQARRKVKARSASLSPSNRSLFFAVISETPTPTLIRRNSTAASVLHLEAGVEPALQRQPFFYPQCSRVQAEVLLTPYIGVEGTFLIRPSARYGSHCSCVHS